MRVLTVADIQNLEPGEAVPSFRAQLKEAKRYTTGTHAEYGPYSIQNLVLMDAMGIMQAKVKNKEEFTKQEVGSWFLFECISSKDGLVGIKLAEETYQGKTSKIINITRTCKVSDGGDRPEPETPRQSAPTPAAARPPAPRPSATSALPDTAQAVKRARERLGQAANGLIMAYDAAVHIMEQVQAKHTEVVFTPDVLEKIAVHLSIGLEKGGSVHGLPTGPLNKLKKKEPEPEPPDDLGEVPF